jgi:hypothetical protein
MWIIPLFIAGTGIVLSLSPDATALVTAKIAAVMPAPLKLTAAAAWFNGHQSLAMMYLSLMLFFVTRTVSRLVDR